MKKDRETAEPPDYSAYLKACKLFHDQDSFAKIVEAIAAHFHRPKAGDPLKLVDSMAGIGLVGTHVREALANIIDMNVVFIDRSPKVLKNIQLQGGDRILSGDATALPIGDGEADIVTVRVGLNNLPAGQWPLALSEIMRVLRDRGCAVLQDHFPRDTKEKKYLNWVERWMARIDKRPEVPGLLTIDEMQEVVHDQAELIVHDTSGITIPMQERGRWKGFDHAEFHREMKRARIPAIVNYPMSTIVLKKRSRTPSANRGNSFGFKRPP